MCHSPSGAFRVQAPDRACWALADITTATERPAASPPDTTCCAKRFITNLREKGSFSRFTTFCGYWLFGRPTGLVPTRADRALRTDAQTLKWTGGPRSTVG